VLQQLRQRKFPADFETAKYHAEASIIMKVQPLVSHFIHLAVHCRGP
jgi:hypothetical protein